MLVLYLLAILVSIYLGGTYQCILLIGLGCWYNDLKGADSSCLTRNFINGCGYTCFTSGALEVISRHSVVLLKPIAHHWLSILGTVVLTTIHTQDMHDQAGDMIHGRCSVPLVIGDSAARWTIAVAIAVWSVICPAFWQINIVGSAASIILGMTIAWRYLSKRSLSEDKTSFRIYNLWIVSLYLLPLIKRQDGV